MKWNILNENVEKHIMKLDFKMFRVCFCMMKWNILNENVEKHIMKLAKTGGGQYGKLLILKFKSLWL